MFIIFCGREGIHRQVAPFSLEIIIDTGKVRDQKSAVKCYIYCTPNSCSADVKSIISDFGDSDKDNLDIIQPKSDFHFLGLKLYK